jgi:hypothetical protein
MPFSQATVQNGNSPAVVRRHVRRRVRIRHSRSDQDHSAKGRRTSPSGHSGSATFARLEHIQNGPGLFAGRKLRILVSDGTDEQLLDELTTAVGPVVGKSNSLPRPSAASRPPTKRFALPSRRSTGSIRPLRCRRASDLGGRRPPAGGRGNRQGFCGGRFCAREIHRLHRGRQAAARTVRCRAR